MQSNLDAGNPNHGIVGQLCVIRFIVLGAVLTLAMAVNSQIVPNTINTVAGGGAINSLPLLADIPGPTAVVEDSKGNVFFAPPAADYVFELSSGTVSVLAGLGWGHYNNNVPVYNGIANQIPLFGPSGLGLDKQNNVFIADTVNNTIRKVYPKNGIWYIETVAGTRQRCILKRWPTCNDGNNHRATDAYLANPQGVVLDHSGNEYIADTGDNVIRFVDHSTQIISHIAGTYGTTCSPSQYQQNGCGNNLSATTAYLNSPMGVSVDGNGNTYFADTGDNAIRCVAAVAQGCGISNSSAGDIYGMAGTGKQGYSGDGGPATAAELGIPRAVSFVASTGAFYIADTNNSCIRMVSSAGTISEFAGTCTKPGFSGDGGPATAAAMATPDGVYADAGGNVFIADTGNQRIRCVAAVLGGCGSGSQIGNIYTILGGGSGGDGSPATEAMLAGPFQVAVDASNNYYIADAANNRIRVVNQQTGYIATVAGTGDSGYSGDKGAATNATMQNPDGVAVDSSGNIYIADTGNGCIREVNAATGVITTVPGTEGTLMSPSAVSVVSVDAGENLFIADPDPRAEVIWEASGGTVTIVAGVYGQACSDPKAGKCGDYGPATKAMFNGPTSVAVANNGDFFIADSNDNRVRCVVGIANTGCRNAGYPAGYIVPYPRSRVLSRNTASSFASAERRPRRAARLV